MKPGDQSGRSVGMVACQANGAAGSGKPARFLVEPVEDEGHHLGSDPVVELLRVAAGV